VIVSARSSAGAFLLRVRTSPCGQCLLVRLRESRVDVESGLASVDLDSLPPAFVSALDEDLGSVAPVVKVSAGEAIQHLLMPLPGCECAALRQTGAAPHTEILEALLDPLLGIASPTLIANRASNPELTCDVVIGHVHVPRGESRARAIGWGIGPEAASASFLGEVVERYAAFRPDMSRIRAARLRDVPCGPALLLGFSGFDDEQRRGTDYVALGEDDEIGWIEGRALADGSARPVPAASVYLTRAYRPDEPKFSPMHSTGLAAHTSAQAASANARLEVLERLATSLLWHRRTLGALLPTGVLSTEGTQLGAAVERQGRTLRLCLASAPGAVPVVVAVILGDAFPWITFGSAARRTLGDAATAALGEAAMLWDHPPAPEPSAGEMPKVASPRRHFLWHATDDRSRMWRQQLGETPPAAHWDPAAEAGDEQIVRELLAASPAAVEVDLTPADVASQGYRVVKIAAPGIPFLQFGSLGAPRRHLRRFGLEPGDDIHPFA
jgi:thiazole/oxazole-forming peptide maturase SagD family component